MRILIVEDERALCDAIARSLRNLAYSVDCCHDGQEALDLLDVEAFDLVILDLNLPRIDGMTVLRELRKTDCETKVLILSARGEVSDKVAGLDAGANDYLTKPFHLDELAARIRSLTLRRFTQSDVVLTCRKLRFDTKARIASVDSETLSLTRKETGILEYLMLNQGRPVSQEELIEHVWDSSVNSFSNATRVHISSLRKSCAALWDTTRFAIGLERATSWRMANERAFAAMAHNDHDGTADVCGVRADELPGRLYGHALHGCHRQWHLGP